MKISAINQKIIHLWNKYFSNDTEACAPLFYGDFKKNQLLFVGMNPSFSERGFKTILRGTEYEHIQPSVFYKWSNISSNHALIDDCIKIEKYAVENYSIYFKRIKEIAHEVHLPWQHIDLFLYRETSQKNFMNRVYENYDNGVLNEFGIDQINLFEEILIEVEPSCIIVSNAKASEILREYIKDDLKWDEEMGFDWFVRGGRKIPIFFTSMLSGQRSLDRWSYERLKWHIRKAVKAGKFE